MRFVCIMSADSMPDSSPGVTTLSYSRSSAIMGSGANGLSENRSGLNDAMPLILPKYIMPLCAFSAASGIKRLLGSPSFTV